MYRTPIPKILFLIAICAWLPAMSVFAQTKPTGEVDVTKCWAYPLGEDEASALASDGVRVYIGGASAKVEALSLDGKKMWATELGGDITSNLLAGDLGLFLVTTTVAEKAAPSNILRSLSRETGITNWSAKLPDASQHFLGAYKDAVIVVSKSGVIQSLDAKTGVVRWKREIADGFASPPAFTGEKMIVASTGKQVFVISLANGEIDSLRKVPSAVTAIGQSVSGNVVVGDERGNATLFVGTTEKPYWKFRSGGEVSAIFPVDGHILITSHDNFAYSLSTRNGGVAWKRRLSGRVSQIATFRDKFAIISSFEDHGAVIVDLITGKVAGQIALGLEEFVTYDAVVADGLIFILTNQSAYAFSLSGCPTKKEDGPDKSPATAPLK